jgi:hypothetical protein
MMGSVRSAIDNPASLITIIKANSVLENSIYLPGIVFCLSRLSADLPVSRRIVFSKISKYTKQEFLAVYGKDEL